jgi:hypothetical protein
MSVPAGPATAPFRMGRYWFVLALILIFAAWPLLPVAIANAVAAMNHCPLLEAGPQPCPVGGGDWGATLWGMASLVKVSFFSIPAGVTLLFFWVLALVVGLATHVRRESGTNTPRADRVNFLWYALALVVLLAVAYMVLLGVLPGVLLFLVIFAAIFWIFSFAFAVYSTLRRARTRP